MPPVKHSECKIGQTVWKMPEADEGLDMRPGELDSDYYKHIVIRQGFIEDNAPNRHVTTIAVEEPSLEGHFFATWTEAVQAAVHRVNQSLVGFREELKRQSQ